MLMLIMELKAETGEARKVWKLFENPKSLILVGGWGQNS